MERSWFIFYKSFYEALSSLPDQNQLELYQAITRYSFTGKAVKLKWLSLTIWTLIKPQLDANLAKYNNWKKGWRPEKNWDNSQKPNGNLNESKSKAKEKEKEERIKDKDKEKNKAPHSEEFEEALLEFRDMREWINKPITPKGLELIKNEVETFYPDREDLQILCLNKSIANSRQGVFLLSQEDIKLHKSREREKREKKEREEAITIIPQELTPEQKKEIKEKFEALRKNSFRP